VPLGGGATNGESTNASISANGRYVAFISKASNLVVGDANGSPDAFLFDRQTSQLTLISVGFNGSGGWRHVLRRAASLGRTAASWPLRATRRTCWRTPFVADWGPRLPAGDLQTGTTTLASFGPGGADVKTSCTLYDMSADGRYVAFHGGVATTVQHVHVWDRVTNLRAAQDVTPGGTLGNAVGASPFLSPDGRWVAFASLASDLVSGDHQRLRGRVRARPHARRDEPREPELGWRRAQWR
jgi:Tol biopolymer transport system component